MPTYATEIASLPPATASAGMVLLFLWLPGYLFWKMLIARSEKFKAFCIKEYGFWTALLVQMTISVLFTGWAGFVLGELGIFNVYYIAAIVGALCLVLVVVGNPGKMWKSKGYRQTQIRGTVQDSVTRKEVKDLPDALKKHLRILKNLINLVLLRNEILYIPVLIVIGVVMFIGPIHNVWRGRRDGADALCGIQLSRKGGFLVEDDLLSEIPSKSKEVLFFKRNVETDQVKYMRFPSYFSVPGPESDSTYPAFLHFHSTWLGLSCSLFGIPQLYYITPVFALISIGVIFLFINTLSSVKTAFLAILLLILNVAQIYFVRFSSSVITAQLFVFAGLYFFLVFSRTNLKPFGIMSGIAFGQAVLCGNGLFHYFMLAGFLSLCATYSPRRQARVRFRYIILPFFLFLSQAILFDIVAGTKNLIIFAESLTMWIIGSHALGAWESYLPAAIKIAVIFIGVLIIISIAFPFRRREKAGPIRKVISYGNGLIVRTLGYGLILCQIILFYATRPPFIRYEGGIVYPSKWIHKFIDEMGLIFLLIGIGFFIYFRFFKKKHHMVYFPTFLFLICMIEIIWDPATSSILPNGFRKFIPIFLPFAYFLVAYSLFAFRELTRNLEFGKAFGGMIAFGAVSLILITGQNGLLLKTHRPERDLSADVFKEYRKAFVDKLEKADISPEESVFLFMPGLRDPLVPMTLTYVFDIKSVHLHDGALEQVDMPDVIEDLIDAKKQVFLVAQDTQDKAPKTIGQLKVILFGSSSISIARIAETQGERIKSIVEKGMDPTTLMLYRIVKPM